MSDTSSTVVSKAMKASCEAVYGAFTDPDALAAWLPPGSMHGIVHDFDGREGGSLRMSLVYPEDEGLPRGKTLDNIDTFDVRFVALVPASKIVWAVRFESDDPAYAGEMLMTTTMEPAGSGSQITIACDDIPRGIRPEDNETGCRSTLNKLASFLGG